MMAEKEARGSMPALSWKQRILRTSAHKKRWVLTKTTQAHLTQVKFEPIFIIKYQCLSLIAALGYIRVAHCCIRF